MIPDPFDRAILALLQQDNRMPQRLIAEKVGLSAPAVQRRVQRLEAGGVIAANVAIVDPAALGRPLTILVEVEVANESGERIDDLKRRFLAAPEVQQCYYVTGEVDFMLVVTVTTMADYEEMTRRLFFADENVRKFRTFVTMDRVKTGMTIPVL
jgi:Lrp/AsnC family leucine-responsive transcriptional regulator